MAKPAYVALQHALQIHQQQGQRVEQHGSGRTRRSQPRRHIPPGATAYEAPAQQQQRQQQPQAEAGGDGGGGWGSGGSGGRRPPQGSGGRGGGDRGDDDADQKPIGNPFERWVTLAAPADAPYHTFLCKSHCACCRMSCTRMGTPLHAFARVHWPENCSFSLHRVAVGMRTRLEADLWFPWKVAAVACADVLAVLAINAAACPSEPLLHSEAVASQVPKWKKFLCSIDNLMSPGWRTS